MNLLNIAVGGLAGGLTNSPLTSLIGIGGAALAGSAPSGGTSGIASLGAGAASAGRDDLVSALPDISSSVNALAQAANSGSSGSADASSMQLSLPPLPQMPQAQKPPAVPTDDHGQSNVVMQDSEADGSLIL